LPTQRTAQTEEKQRDINALYGFEPTIALFERAKTFHALGRVAAVTGNADFSKW
jgi:hypothetical protein